MWLFSR